MPENALTFRKLCRDEVQAIVCSTLRRHFPRNELRPLWSVRQLQRQGRYAGWGAFAGETLAGYALLCWDDKGTALLDYLAVMENFRCQGAGGALMHFLLSDGTRLPWRRLIIEVDDPDFAPDERERALRLRRMAFYRRTGVRETGVRVRLFGARYRVFTDLPPDAMTDEACQASVRAMYPALIAPWLLRGHLETRVAGKEATT